ncbi:MAG: hypothetical protein KBD78_10425 [Oligoflexales bacterium]|nr:hypothetical protein [Oligoflexales bacterium]
MSEQQQWLSIVEYARTFSVSDMTVRRRIKNGRLAADLRDGKYFIPVNKNSQNNLLVSTPKPIVVDNENARYQSHSAPSVAAKITSTEVAGKTIKTTYAPPGNLGIHTQKSEPPYQGIQPYSNEFAAREIQRLQSKIDQLNHVFSDALRKIETVEKNLEESFKYQLLLKDEIISRKDAEIKNLQQKIEDLQLLIEILEKSS